MSLKQQAMRFIEANSCWSPLRHIAGSHALDGEHSLQHPLSLSVYCSSMACEITDCSAHAEGRSIYYEGN